METYQFVVVLAMGHHSLYNFMCSNDWRARVPLIQSLCSSLFPFHHQHSKERHRACCKRPEQPPLLLCQSHHTFQSPKPLIFLYHSLFPANLISTVWPNTTTITTYNCRRASQQASEIEWKRWVESKGRVNLAASPCYGRLAFLVHVYSTGSFLLGTGGWGWCMGERRKGDEGEVMRKSGKPGEWSRDAWWMHRWGGKDGRGMWRGGVVMGNGNK